MFFFPIRSDRRLQHTPWMNVILIAINVAVFVLFQKQHSPLAWHVYELNPSEPQLWQGWFPYTFITYQFMHADWMHLGGNMLFLYVFGNSVEDRLGKVGYLAFYLAGGVLAGLAHGMTDSNPVLGASGSVAAVTGAYLALFPLSNVTIFYFMIMIGTFEMTSIVLIIFQIAQNLLMSLIGGGGVAYTAHLGGYAFGFAVGMGLLRSRLLPREPYDFPALLEHRRRRREFAGMTRQGYQPWELNRVKGVPTAGTTSALDPRQNDIMALRSVISEAIHGQRHEEAAAAYERLLELDGSQVMGQQNQLDLANFFMAQGRYESAARAYELFLGAYGRYGQREQVELILALLYARYLDRRQRARELLVLALPKLRDPQQVEQAQQTLAMIQG